MAKLVYGRDFTLGPAEPAFKEPVTIDATPTWEAVVPLLMAVIENGTFEGRAAAEQELRRMAKLADLYVASCRKGR